MNPEYTYDQKLANNLLHVGQDRCTFFNPRPVTEFSIWRRIAAEKNWSCCSKIEFHNANLKQGVVGPQCCESRGKVNSERLEALLMQRLS